MRPLPLLVLGESALLVTLAALWLAKARPYEAVAAPVAAAREGDPASAERLDHREPARTAPGEAAIRSATGTGASPDLGIIVTGRLQMAGGEPAPNEASVWFQREGIAYRSGTVWAGRYAVTGLAPGAWTVQASSDGCATHHGRHEVTGEAVQTLDIVLDRAHRVTVFLRTPDGAPLEDAVRFRSLRGLRVVVTAEPLAGDLPATENASVGDLGIGRYTSVRESVGVRPKPEGPDGELQLDRPPPAHAALLLRHVLLARQPLAPGQDKLTFTLDPKEITARLGTVRLRLVDGITAQPITDGVSVSFATAQGGGGGGSKPDATGRVEAAGLMPGHLAMTIGGKGRETLWTLVRVPSGAALELGDVALHAPLSLKGRLLDEAGKPVSGSVQWTDLDTMTFPRELVTRRSAAADGDGDFELLGGPRRYVVIASTQDGLLGTAVVDARTAPSKPFEVRMAKPVDIAVQVTGDVLLAYTVTVRDRQGVPIAARRLEPRWRRQTLAVPPGDYTLEVHDDTDRLVKKLPIRAGSAAIRIEVP